MSDHRLSFGNGQVSEEFNSYASALRAYWDQVDYSRRVGQSSYSRYLSIQAWDGEWYTLPGAKGRPAKDLDAKRQEEASVRSRGSSRRRR